MYELVYLEQNLFEREDVLPPCEYFKPAYQVDQIQSAVLSSCWTLIEKMIIVCWIYLALIGLMTYQVQKNLGRVYDNITTYASITFSPQVYKISRKIITFLYQFYRTSCLDLDKCNWFCLYPLSEIFFIDHFSQIYLKVEVWEMMEKYSLLSYLAEVSQSIKEL